MSNSNFLRDREVAHFFAMSTSWVRGQRLKRLHGKDHVLAIDPIYVGDSPRYLASEVEALSDKLCQSRS